MPQKAKCFKTDCSFAKIAQFSLKLFVNLAMSYSSTKNCVI